MWSDGAFKGEDSFSHIGALNSSDSLEGHVAVLGYDSLCPFGALRSLDSFDHIGALGHGDSLYSFGTL